MEHLILRVRAAPRGAGVEFLGQRTVGRTALVLRQFLATLFHIEREVRHHRVGRQRTVGHFAIAPPTQPTKVDHHLAHIEFGIRRPDGFRRAPQLVARQTVGRAPELRRIVELQAQPRHHRLRPQLVAQPPQRGARGGVTPLGVLAERHLPLGRIVFEQAGPPVGAFGLGGVRMRRNSGPGGEGHHSKLRARPARRVGVRLCRGGAARRRGRRRGVRRRCARFCARGRGRRR